MIQANDAIEASALRRAVQHAWATALKPPEENVADGDILESDTMRRIFAGKRSDEISLDDPAVLGEAPLHYLSDEAVAYFLQNYLKLVLSVERFREDPDWAKSHVQVQQFISGIGWIGERLLGGFVNDEQRRCVCDVLKFIAKHGDDYGLGDFVGLIDYRERLSQALTVWCTDRTVHSDSGSE